MPRDEARRQAIQARLADARARIDRLEPLFNEQTGAAWIRQFRLWVSNVEKQFLDDQQERDEQREAKWLDYADQFFQTFVGTPLTTLEDQVKHRIR